MPGTVIDALCHLPLFASLDEAKQALDDAFASGVTDVICGGTDPRSPEKAPASTRPRVHRAYGIHPEHVDDESLDEQLFALERKLDDKGVVALGECGVDHRRDMPPLELQLRALHAQIEIARRRDLPLIIHAVRSPARIVDVMKAAKVRWMWHGFSDSLDVARAAIAVGAVISVGPLVLNESARRLREAVSGLDADLLIESDAPHTPSATLASVIAEVALLRRCAAVDVVAGSIRAARSLFRLDRRDDRLPNAGERG